jgi:hypothetical protein
MSYAEADRLISEYIALDPALTGAIQIAPTPVSCTPSNTWSWGNALSKLERLVVEEGLDIVPLMRRFNPTKPDAPSSFAQASSWLSRADPITSHDRIVIDFWTWINTRVTSTSVEPPKGLGYFATPTVIPTPTPVVRLFL